MAETAKIALTAKLLETPQFSQNFNLVMSEIRRLLRTNLTLFAFPATLCFIGAIASFVNTQSFASFTVRMGQANAALFLAVMGLLWYPLLYYLKKLRGVNKERFFVKMAVEIVIMFVDVIGFLIYHFMGNARLVLFLFGLAINLADFAGVGGCISHKCGPTFVMGIFVSHLHWGFTSQGFLVLAVISAYRIFRDYVVVLKA